MDRILLTRPGFQVVAEVTRLSTRRINLAESGRPRFRDIGRDRIDAIRCDVLPGAWGKLSFECRGVDPFTVLPGDNFRRVLTGAPVIIDPGVEDVMNYRMGWTRNGDKPPHHSMTLENEFSEHDVGNITSRDFDWSGSFSATADRLLVACIGFDGDVTGISIDSGDFTQIHTQTSDTNCTGWQGYKVATGGETGFTLSWTQSEDLGIWVGEFSGNETTGVQDTNQIANNNGNNSTPLATGTDVNTAQANELLVSAFAFASSADSDDGRSYSGSNAPTDLTEHTFLGNASGDPGLAVCLDNLTSVTNCDVEVNLTTADQTVAMFSTFLEATGGAPAVRPNTMSLLGVG